MRLIKRTYLKELIDLIGTPDIKIITGVRRCGKSKLMSLFIDYIRNNIPNANIIQIDFNLLENESLREYHALYSYIEKQFIQGVHNFICVDEIQMCGSFELAINSLHAKEKYDIYLTGSNAFLLSSDLSTLFTGRQIEVKVFPFSYKEFLEYYSLPPSSINFDRYVTEGGMPGTFLFNQASQKNNYVQSVYDLIINRDLVIRKNIHQKTTFGKIALYLLDNVSNLTSAHNIAMIFTGNNESITNKTVSKYIDALCETFLFYHVKRYDVKGKKILSANEKYYLVDSSFKYALLGRKNMDYGRVYENIVAVELLRRGYEVYVGILYRKEIDFVAINRDEKVYIQVADNISLPETFEREITSLLKIKDAYPKILLARTNHEEYTYEGVRIIDIGDWLSR